MPTSLAIEHLGHQYLGATRETFIDVNFKVAGGEFVAILGASGSGKSTLLRSIAGLEMPNRGSIRVGDELVIKDGELLVPAERRQIGMVFQDYALFPSMTVAENILFGVPSSSDGAGALARWATLLRLDGLLERFPSQLSGGQQQRVALARALAPEPKLLLLDEPFANLDARLRQEVGHELRGLFAESDMAVVLVTHDRSEAFALADRVAVLSSNLESKRSSLRQLDTPLAIYRRPIDTEVAELTGELTLMPDAQANGTQAVWQEQNFELQDRRDGAVTLLVRPDDLRFVASDHGSWGVEQRIYCGGEYHVWLANGERRVRVHLAEGDAPVVGEQGELQQIRPLWPI